MIKELHNKLISGEITAVGLAEEYFAHIEKKDKEILFAPYLKNGNYLNPTKDKMFIFNISHIKIYSIEIIPTKEIMINGQMKIASCGDAKVKEQVSCN